MILQIISTTNREFLGFIFEDIYPIVLPNGGKFTPEYVVNLPSGDLRLITSNFIIDVKEI